MAATGLSIGLWVRLADMGATRPSGWSGKYMTDWGSNSWRSLVVESGWADHVGIDYDWTVMMSGDQAEEDAFLDLFRGDDFFQNVLTDLSDDA